MCKGTTVASIYAKWKKQHAKKKKEELYKQFESSNLTMDLTFMALLKDCAKRKDVHGGTKIHADVMENKLLGKSPYIASSVISMYVKCGVLLQAEQVLKELPTRNVVTWNALIAGYAAQKKIHEAVDCFKRMQMENLLPDAVTFISILKACGKARAIDRGMLVHNEIVNRGLLEKDIVVGNALVDMYAKCGFLRKAEKLFSEFPRRDIVSWSSLITGYTMHGQALDALNCFKEMQAKGISPNSVTFICVLKACSSLGALDDGKRIHEEILVRGLLVKDTTLGTALVDMYAKCGMIKKAQEVLDELSFRDVVSWSALILGYAQQGQVHEVMNCFEQMKNEGLSPDAITFICILKVCSSTGDIDKGEQIHDAIATSGLLHKDIALTNALVDMYVKCGLLVKAEEVFEEAYFRDIISWNVLITGYVQQGECHLALNCFERMLNEGLHPNEVTFTCVLQACGNAGTIDQGRRIHEAIKRDFLLCKDIMIGNALVDMYAKFGMLSKALEVIKQICVRDVSCWNSLIARCTDQGKGAESIRYFEQMKTEGICPNVVTFISILKACSSTGDLGKGRQIHKEIKHRGLLDDNVPLGNVLIDMYVRCGVLSKAQEVLNGLLNRDIVSWNTLLTGYVLKGYNAEALNCYEQIQKEGLCPDIVTFICVLKICGRVGAINKCTQIHNEIINRGLVKKDVILGNALVDMYARCGHNTEAQRVLEELPFQDVGSWNALISGYIRQGKGYEALICYELMQRKGVLPDVITFICILNACGLVGAINNGEKIHSEIVNRGLIEKNLVLGNVLVNMYAKCGMPDKAARVLREFNIRDIVAWNALITGYAQQGFIIESVNCFEQMKNDGLSPDEATFVCVLNASSHAGLLNEAEMIFGEMTKNYGIERNIEHHTCMVVMFGQAGYFEKAISVIKVMPSTDHPTIWLALLGACRKWGNVKLGVLIFDQVIQLDSGCVPAYVHMANTFAAAGMQHDAERVETMKLKYTLCELLV